jgi:peptidoglycan hydrolase-like protein with peptidoglycan-binding domain
MYKYGISEAVSWLRIKVLSHKLAMSGSLSTRFALALGGLVLAVAQPVAAQGFYSYASPVSSCINISRDLYQGMRGSDVTSLQTFLVSRNYPGGGNWMVTGYYGAATAAAVRNFQTAQGIAPSGRVDGQTRLALDRVSCGDSTYSYDMPSYVPTTPSYTYPTYTTPSYTYPTYSYTTPTLTNPVYNCPSYGGYYYGYTGVGNYNGGCGNYSYNQQYQTTTPTVAYLSTQSGSVGTPVTVFGNGFSTTGNTVRFGNGVITGLSSADGRSLSFTVPSQLSGFGSQAVALGTYYVSVTNAGGYTSNTVPFTVTSLGSYGAPSVTGVTGPTTLATGTQGTWTLSTNNQSNTYLTADVQWGDGQTSTQQLIGTGSQATVFSHAYTQAGTYTAQFKVTNGSGQSSISSVTVSVSGTNAGSLSISTITPTQGRIGTQIVIQGTGFSTYDNTIRFGSGGTMHVPSYNGTTIYYTVPQYLSPCDITPQSGVCAQYLQIVTPGTSYQLSVSNGSATSNSVSFTVTQ